MSSPTGFIPYDTQSVKYVTSIPSNPDSSIVYMLWDGIDASKAVRYEFSSGALQSDGVIEYEFANLDAAPTDHKTINIDGEIFESVNGEWQTKSRRVLPIKTACGTYAGTGSTLSVSLGFRPTVVFVKADAAVACQYKTDMGWYDRTDCYGIEDSTGAGVTLTEDGFTVGTSAKLNVSATTYHYFAICDNGANCVIPYSWQGNGASRVIDFWKGKQPEKILIKRDSAQSIIVVNKNKGSGSNVSGAGITGSISDDGLLTLGNDATTNQWSTNLGEGTVGLAYCKHPDFYHTAYVGVNAVKTIPLPFEAEAVFIYPITTGASSTTMMWWSTLPQGSHLPIGAGGVSTGRITSVQNNLITLPINNYTNAPGVVFGVMAFKKRRNTAYIDKPYNLAVNKYVRLRTGGYINCGTSDTLKFDGACTLEWCGAIYPDSALGVPYASGLGAGINDVSGKQVPLIFRSLGADGADGAVSFGLAAVAPRPEGTGQTGADWNGFNLVWATFDKWELPQTGAPVLDNFPCFSGVKLEIGRFYHIMLTHNGLGLWRLYINGVCIKERNRNLVTAIGKANITGGTGHRTVIGGRQRASSVDHAVGQQAFIHARIYDRELSPIAAKRNFDAACGYGSPVAGFIEEWHSKNASNWVLSATVHSVNNGNIYLGDIEG